MGEAIVKRKRYGTATYILAIIALLCIPVGWYLFEIRGIFDDIFDYPLIPDFTPFKFYHGGVVLLLSATGILLGIVNKMKNKEWSVGFFINVIVFGVVLGFSV